MDSTKRMIDRAADVCGSRSEVARRLGVAPQRLWDWESGRRSMPDEAIIEIALIAGVDPRAALGAYRWEWHAKKKGRALAGIAALGCLLAALTGAAPTTANATSGAEVSGLLAAHYAQRCCWIATLLQRLKARMHRTNQPLRALRAHALPALHGLRPLRA